MEFSSLADCNAHAEDSGTEKGGDLMMPAQANETAKTRPSSIPN
jgi:hypothetical protein